MSNERTITDTDLVEFCKWYADFHGDTDIETSVIVTCLCGYFHTFPKQPTSCYNGVRNWDWLLPTATPGTSKGGACFFGGGTPW